MFYFYQKDQASMPTAPASPQVVDDTLLKGLKKLLPPGVFEREIQPFLEKNRQGGLSSEQLDALTKKLEKSADALGGKAASAVREILQKTPGLSPSKTMLERAADTADSLAEDAAGEVKRQLPVLKDLALKTLQGLTTLVSRFLGVVANILN